VRNAPSVDIPAIVMYERQAPSYLVSNNDR
jgi:hypothetical protein